MTCRKSEIIDSLDTFTRAYLECSLWSSTDNSTESGGYPLDDNYGISDIEGKSLRAMVADCAAFQADNANDLEGLDSGACGHDFWLSRNGHGAGFWNRGLGERGDRLHKATKPYGSCDLMVYRGKVYAS